MEYANCGMAGTYAIVSQGHIKRKLGRGHFSSISGTRQRCHSPSSGPDSPVLMRSMSEADPSVAPASSPPPLLRADIPGASGGPGQAVSSATGHSVREL